MPFTIPNDVSGGSAEQHTLSAPTAFDFNVLANATKGTGVVFGLDVTPQGSPDMTVNVAAGGAVWNDNEPVSEAASLHMTSLGTVGRRMTSAATVRLQTANSANPRLDLIVYDPLRNRAYAVIGQAAANPVPPSVPYGCVALAIVYVAANDTTISSTDIVDKRVILKRLVQFSVGNQVENNNTPIDTPLVMPVASGVRYAFKVGMICSSGVTGTGFVVALTTPTLTRFTACEQIGAFAADGTTAMYFGVHNTSGDQVVSSSVVAAAVSNDVMIVGEGVIVPSADGDLRVQVCAETAAITVVTFRGYLELEVLE